MYRAWIAAFGVVALAVSAFSIYLAQRSPPPGRESVSAVAEKGVFSVLAKPTTLPDVTFTDGEGRSMRLSNFRGKTILLNVWATWCAPCRKEMPALERLQARLGGPGFQVVAVSIDRGGAVAVKSFYEELAIEELRIYVDTTIQVSSNLNAIGLPTTLLIDAQGREIGRKVGPAEWDSPEVVKMIEKYLAASKPGSTPSS
ncbi:MAG: TlpA family protein disulfide reductase [Betaproteobacteria bacterium]